MKSQEALVPETIEIKMDKCYSDVREIEIHDSDEDIHNERELLNIFKERTKQNAEYRGNGNIDSYLSKNPHLRGLLPVESDKSYFCTLKLPVVKRCCIEHGYFIKSRAGTSRYSLRNLPVPIANTVPFENENRHEQQTIDFKRITPEDINSVLPNYTPNDSDARSDKNKKKLIKNNNGLCKFEKSVACESNGKQYRPNERSSGSESVGEGCAKLKKRNSPKYQTHLDQETNVENVSDEAEESHQASRNSLERTGHREKRKIPRGFVSVHELLTKIKSMQKLMRAKCDKKMPGNPGKIPPPKLKRMISSGKNDDFPKISEYLFPMPNLTRMTGINKNWRVNYMDNDVHNLGLDDLLLKASELNAENFTKALGRKLDTAKSNFRGTEASEFVLTIPKSRQNSSDSKKTSDAGDQESSKRKILAGKSVKLNFSGTTLETEKIKEDEATRKSMDENSLKIAGIKVKTVENINEEFKDFHEFATKDRSLNKPIVENNKNKSNAGTLMSPKSDSVIGKNDNLNLLEEKRGDETRPFIMTIVQSKTEKKRPAILRNSSYFKKKHGFDGLKRPGKVSDKSTEEKDAKTPEKPPEGGDDQSPSNFNISFSDILSSGYFSKFPNGLEDGFPESKFRLRKKGVPYVLNHRRKQDGNTGHSAEYVVGPFRQTSTPKSLAKPSEASDKILGSDKLLMMTSTEQKLKSKVSPNKRYIKLVSYEPDNKQARKMEPNIMTEFLHKQSDEDSDAAFGNDGRGHALSLTTFSSILKEILPDKWFLCNDKKYGLQIVKTQIDEFLNPSILISVVIGRCGKVTVNVHGKQLHKSHKLFSNLCQMGNSENKVSVNYVLSIINRLRFLNACYGCDQPLKKHWNFDECSEHRSQVEEEIYRSHLCHLLVAADKKRCYPCYCMNESLKKRYRREKDGELGKDFSPNEIRENQDVTDCGKLPSRGVKRNLEDFLEESFSTMKQQIVNEIEKNKKLGERENALKAQEEVLSFMGLARKDSLGNPVRKSKRKKKSFYKLQQPVKKKIDQRELELLEKYWTDINTLFSTSLLFGAYSRTGRTRLREKCRMFHKLLSTWREIVRSNPEWIGQEIAVPNATTVEDSKEISQVDPFEKMDVPALRSYIINSVKEVNRIKHKLRTRNSYFKVLYNKFVKRRMTRPKVLSPNSDKKETASSANSATNTPTNTPSNTPTNTPTNTPSDLSSDESSRDKEKTMEGDATNPTEPLPSTPALGD